ncbi:MAG TPA: hypothetical protein VMV38_02145 [Candidatus Paceibacterota bacterium]|nr:hypothetical protein [Candidatus Paceibacterota bacterium]
MSLVTPAVLPVSREDLEKKIARFVGIPAVTRIQIDTVDGKFATPASWPYVAPEEMRDLIRDGVLLPTQEQIEYEIDLMCLDALSAAGNWLALGASRLTFHAESAIDIGRLLASAIKQFGTDAVSFGLALNVTSDVALLEVSLAHISYVQFMGIATIGRQGQPFDRRVLEKIRLFRSRHPEIPVQVDGGVSLDTARELLALGVSTLIAGSSLLRASDPRSEIAKFEALQNPYRV